MLFSALLAAAGMLATSCAGGGSSEAAALQQPDTQRTLFNLHILGESICEGGEFGLEVADSGQATEVSVRVKNAVGLKAAYFELEYEARELAQPLLLSDGLLGAGRDSLSLTVTDVPGMISHGEVLANWPEREGFSGDGVLATFRFEQAAGGQNSFSQQPSRSVATVPDADNAAHYLNFSPKSSVFLWYYVNPGDYDQNGEVGITDLTPLGANFNDEGPFDVTDARSVIDGDGNDVINIADITPIGVNFGNRIDSYAVHASASAGDYPGSNTADNGAGSQLVGTQPFSAASGGGSQRKYWDHVMKQPIIGHANYWLRPGLGGNEGTPSQLVTHDQEWHLETAHEINAGGGTWTVSGLSASSIDGHPAYLLVVVGEGSNVEFRFDRSDDAAGSSWSSPLVIFNGAASHRSPNLAEINGRPALTWWDDASIGGLRFMRALDEDGASWAMPVTVDSFIDSGISSRLLEVEGRPFVVYSDGAQQLNARLAANAEGSAWLNESQVYSPAVLSHFDAVVLPGGVGVAVEDDDTGAVIYRNLAVAENVINVGPEVEIFPEFVGSSGFVDLGISNDRPYISSSRDSGFKIYYTHALEFDGSSWTAPVQAGLSGSMLTGGGIEAYGVPWVWYFNDASSEFRSGHLVAPGSNEWTNEGNIPGTTLMSGGFTWLTAGIHPAIVYADYTDQTIRIAVFY